MSKNILYLFPDTNVFIQCRPLDQLDWSKWKEFSEVHLMVCRPVQREIDNQKTRGNTRVGNKARSTYTLFRKIIESTQGYELVNSSNPKVKLFLEGLSRPSPELQDTLDYSKTDDEIVGCLHRFRRENPDSEARLLTDDGGPMMTARALELPYVPVNKDWLLPPENNDSEKENARLRERITQLEKTEPQFRIELVDEEGEPLEQLEIEHIIYDPLSDETVKSLMELLTTKFPKATYFGRRESEQRNYDATIFDLLAPRGVYIPAKDEEVDRYSNRDYPKWIRDCRKSLSSIHEKLQIESERLSFVFAIANEGSSPGKDALVNIVAKGNFKIHAPPYIPESEKLSELQVMLPTPPSPPNGRWSSLRNELDRSMILSNIFRDPFALSLPPLQNSQRRDPNGFFYKPGRPTTPGDTITLECEQWRHNTGKELFTGRISVAPTAQEIKGALICEVHAENLTEPGTTLIHVRITTTRADSAQRAMQLIEQLEYLSKSE